MSYFLALIHNTVLWADGFPRLLLPPSLHYQDSWKCFSERHMKKNCIYLFSNDNTLLNFSCIGVSTISLTAKWCSLHFRWGWVFTLQGWGLVGIRIDGGKLSMCHNHISIFWCHQLRLSTVLSSFNWAKLNRCERPPLTLNHSGPRG